jgi:hypothetical protein
MIQHPQGPPGRTDIRKAIRILCIASYFLLTTGNAQSAEGVCNCDDMAQIQRRIDEDDVAINFSTDVWLKGLQGVGVLAPQLKPTAAIFEQSLGADLGHSSFALAPVFTTDSPSNTSPPPDCEPHYTEPDLTGCIHEALQVHEQVHVAACKSGRSLSLRDFVQEEINAYTAERNFLVGERNRLLCTCPYYALRFSSAATMKVQGANEQVSAEGQAQGPTSNDIIVPLKMEAGGKVSGQAQAETKANETASGTMNCQVSGGAPLAISVDGQLTPLPIRHLQADLTVETGEGTFQIACPGSGLGPLSRTTKGGSSGKFAFDIPGFDTPVKPSSEPPIPSLATVAATSELTVADPWPNTKASNGRGSTVGDALHEIGMPSCSQ